MNERQFDEAARAGRRVRHVQPGRFLHDKDWYEAISGPDGRHVRTSEGTTYRVDDTLDGLTDTVPTLTIDRLLQAAWGLDPNTPLRLPGPDGTDVEIDYDDITRIGRRDDGEPEAIRIGTRAMARRNG